MPNPLQLWLAQRLYDMCEHGSLNKQRCCIAGVFKTVLEVLTDSQQPDKAFIEDVEGVVDKGLMRGGGRVGEGLMRGGGRVEEGWVRD